MDRVTPHRRRVVHRRAAIDRAWSRALADFAPETHQAIRDYYTAMQAANAARDKLGDVMIRSTGRLQWWRIDAALRNLS